MDQTCPTEAVAVRKLGCVGPFSNFANGFLDLIFTAMFGIVGTLPSALEIEDSV